MRFIIIISLISTLAAVEIENPRAQRALEAFGSATRDANERLEADIRSAHERHTAAIDAATTRAVRAVSGLMSNRIGPAEQAGLYRLLLALDPQHQEARRFFSAVGTLDAVLEETKGLRHQLMGSIPEAGEVASPEVADPFTAPVEGRVFLSDLQETVSSVGYGSLGKNGDMGYQGWRMLIGGREAGKGLSPHPPNNGYSSVTYQLGAHRFRRFTAIAAMHDRANNQVTPVTFQVWGDGQLLHETSPLRGGGVQEAVSVAISGVRALELRVVCTGQNTAANALWAYPELHLR